jgi:hypothetical protein
MLYFTVPTFKIIRMSSDRGSNYEFYAKLNSNIILKIKLNELNQYINEVIQLCGQNLEGFSIDSRTEVLRDFISNDASYAEATAKKFQLGILIDKNYFYSIKPKGYCVLFAMVACKEQLIVKHVADNELQETKRKRKYYIGKISDCNFQRVDVFNYTNENDSILLTTFVRDLLNDQTLCEEDKKVLNYMLHRLVKKKCHEGKNECYLSSSSFIALMNACGVGKNYALFQGAPDILRGDDDGDRTVWLAGAENLDFSIPEILHRIQYTTVVHYEDHAWLQPNVTSKDVKELLYYLVKHLCLVYYGGINIDKNTSYMVEGCSSQIECGTIVNSSNDSSVLGTEVHSPPMIVESTVTAVNSSNDSSVLGTEVHSPSMTVESTVTAVESASVNDAFNALNRIESESDSNSSDHNPPETIFSWIQYDDLASMLNRFVLPVPIIKKVYSLGRDHHCYLSIANLNLGGKRNCVVCQKQTRNICGSCFIFKGHHRGNIYPVCDMRRCKLTNRLIVTSDCKLAHERSSC